MVDRGPLRLGIVGIGQFGILYVKSLKTIPGVDIAWVCGLEESRCREVAEQYGVAGYTTDFREVCDDPAVDGIVVVTPEAAHREATVAALGAGKHVIVEKPLAGTDEDAMAMVDAAGRSGKLLMTAHLLRFDYRYARLKQRLDQIAPVRNVYAFRNFDRSLFEAYCHTHTFTENSIHDIDLILWYVESRVKRVHGYCRNTQEGFPNPDVNWGVLEFDSGVLAVLQSSWMYPKQAAENLQWNAGIQVMGDHGVLEVANDQCGFRANTEDAGIGLLDQTGWATIHGEPRGAFGAMLRHYLACMRGEVQYGGPSPRDAYEAVSIARRLIDDSRRPERTL